MKKQKTGATEILTVGDVTTALDPQYLNCIFVADLSWEWSWKLDNFREMFTVSDPRRQTVTRTLVSMRPSPSRIPVEDAYPEISPEECTSSPESFGDIDISRIDPRFFVRNQAARQAIRSEIFSLLAGKPGAIPPLTIIEVSDMVRKHRSRISTTLVVRLKSNNIANAMLGIRGDVMEGSNFHSLMSAPTADRHLLRVLLSMAAANKFRAVTCDISQASLQSDSFMDKDKFIALPPNCVRLNGLRRGGHINTESPIGLGYKSQFAFFTS